jgi:hypothetical protein
MPTSLLPPKQPLAAGSNLDNAQKSITATWPCLIVSPDAGHRKQFSQAADSSGWKTFATADPHEALQYMCRNLFKLIVLDFQEFAQPETNTQIENYRSLAEYIRWIGGSLLVINGPEKDSSLHAESVELWARQLGAWTYLPGGFPKSNLSDLCDQALQAVDRLHRPRET